MTIDRLHGSIRRSIVALSFFLAASGASFPAAAYTVQSAVADGCHERITFDALRAVRSVLPRADRVDATRNEQALIDDVPFSVDSDMRDLSAITVVLANRDVDLRGHEPGELDQLAPLHGTPDLQDEHCLRAPDDDEPDGSERALEACRALILAKTGSALQGIRDGKVDPAERLDFKVVLELRGSIEANLPRFQVEIGRALHAVQDSFSHAYRKDHYRRITAVLNYVDFVDARLKESRDGPPHRSGLDQCVDVDRPRRDRLVVATTASTELLLAAMDPDRTIDERKALVEDVLDEYLSYEPGCTAANDWCDAPEQQYELTPGCVCHFSPGTRASGSALTLFTALVLSLTLRRRMRS